MPASSDARGNSLLQDILGELKKTNKLLETQNKIVEKMERHARPTIVGQRNPYLERTEQISTDPRVGEPDSGSGPV